MEEFLPDQSQPGYLPTLEKLVAIDLEFSWKSWVGDVLASDPAAPTMTPDTVSDEPGVETYLHRFPPLREPAIVERLVRTEINVRQQCGSPVDVSDYQRRFPSISMTDNQAQAATAVAGSQDGDLSHEFTVLGRKWDRSPVGELPQMLGRYELVEELGAGGMGVVYRARQPDAERDVAIKLLRGDRLNDLPASARDSFLTRFRTEAKATARIDHPHIVAIYDVGVADGLPYFAMQYIRGTTLADLARKSALSPREAARIMSQVALAVQAAHDHGVLHRDLKPQNVMIDEARGTPYVTDFGLAKLVEQETSQTVTGEVMGTPVYMSPEQIIDAGSVTTRSDVYSLGATLYEALSGRLPFTGKSHIDILLKVREEEPLSLRELNPTIDRDLEIICRKCLHKDPHQRYASAGALADDLQSWLDGEPIAARPIGRWERLGRWIRRNPLPSSLAATTAAAILAAIIVGWVGYASATAALEKSQVSDRRARGTINEFFTVVSEDVLLNQPAMQPLRNDLLQKALRLYEQFLADHPDDPELRGEIASTHYRIGRITELLDSSEAALHSYDRARSIQEELLQENQQDPANQAALSTTLNAFGVSLVRLGRFDEARDRLQAAETLRNQLVTREPDNVEYHRLAANTVMNIALLHKNLGLQQMAAAELDIARAGLVRSIALRDKVLDQPAPPPRNLVRDQAMAWFNLGNLLASIPEQHVDALAAVDQSIELFARLAVDVPEDLEVRQRLAVCYRLAGELQGMQENIVGAGESLALAETTMQELAVENPRVPQFQGELARILLMRAGLAVIREDLNAAYAFTSRARDLLQPLIRDDHPLVDDRAEYAKTLRSLAEIHARRQEWQPALELAQEALPHLESVVVSEPTEPSYVAALEELQNLIIGIEQVLAGAEAAEPTRTGE